MKKLIVLLSIAIAASSMPAQASQPQQTQQRSSLLPWLMIGGGLFIAGNDLLRKYWEYSDLKVANARAQNRIIGKQLPHHNVEEYCHTTEQSIILSTYSDSLKPYKENMSEFDKEHNKYIQKKMNSYVESHNPSSRIYSALTGAGLGLGIAGLGVYLQSQKK